MRRHQTTNLGVGGSNPSGRASKSRISKKRRTNRTAIARALKQAEPIGLGRGRMAQSVEQLKFLSCLMQTPGRFAAELLVGFPQDRSCRRVHRSEASSQRPTASIYPDLISDRHRRAFFGSCRSSRAKHASQITAARLTGYREEILVRRSHLPTSRLGSDGRSSRRNIAAALRSKAEATRTSRGQRQ